MSDIAGKMAEWRKTLWGTGPCPDSSQKNFTLSDAEREAIKSAIEYGEDEALGGPLHPLWTRTLRRLLERLGVER